MTWREAVDSDIQKGEELFTSGEDKEYVRTDTDIRKLYEMRPTAPAARQMVLGQFAGEYIYLYSGRDGYEAAKSTIDEQSKMGPNSDQLVAGTIDLWAPQTMMLRNGGIMKRRDKKAALNLLAGNTANKYSSMLLWSPWNELEEVNGEQGEEESEQQKQTRLSVFPKSTFLLQMNEEDSFNML